MHLILCMWALQVRPRGWHLWEKHLYVDGRPVPGGLFDFALYFFHNARAAKAAGTGPYFYLPKMQSHLEARLWNDVFLDAQVLARPDLTSSLIQVARCRCLCQLPGERTATRLPWLGINVLPSVNI